MEITNETWKKINPGGKPKVTNSNGLETVTHRNKDGTETVIRSNADYGTVRMLIDGQMVEVPVNQVKRFHGDPCERRSRRLGGRGYETKK